MAHFAQIDENNVVTQVIVVANSDTADASGVEKSISCGVLREITWRHMEADQLQRLHPQEHAGLGYTYDSERDAFIPPKPFASWILNESTAQWEAPVAMPEDAGTGEPT
jgi:hypothetical protein